MADKGTARAVFLDRDGVIVTPEFRDGRSFAPRTLDAFRLYESAPKCLRSLKEAGFLLVVVTNQPDVGNGLTPLATLEEMHRRMREALPIDDVRVCTHTRDEGCSCRKPRPGMLTNAANALGIALDRSFMIGDRESDVAAGRAAGCQTVFIDLDYAAEAKPRDAHFTVLSLEQATACILAQPRK
jgi:D-glycero-D-manno-heptose 1,7-bisphosphate phosphatase